MACDLALDPGIKLSGTVVGPDGQPLAGCKAINLCPHTMSFSIVTLTSGRVHRQGLDPKHLARWSSATMGRSSRGGEVARGDESGPLTVRLQPAGTVTGRLLDDDGRPRRGVRIDVAIPAASLARITYFPFLNSTLGDDGRFRIEGLIPGVTYDVSVRTDSTLLGDLATGVKLNPGETRDLGDVKIRTHD